MHGGGGAARGCVGPASVVVRCLALGGADNYPGQVG